MVVCGFEQRSREFAIAKHLLWHFFVVWWLGWIVRRRFF